MINFRFHLVSLIAVFLALALGIVVGSTVIDRAIVDSLETQIDRVEKNVAQQRRENSELRQRIEQLNVFTEQVVTHAIDDALPEVPVVVLATRGVDEDSARAAVASIRQAGASAPALLWLEPEWALVDDERREQLAALLESRSVRASALRSEALTLVARRIAAGEFVPAEIPVDAATPEEETTTAPEDEEGGGEETPEETRTTAPVPTLEVDVLEALVELGLLEVDRAGAAEFDMSTYPGPGARVLVISGPEARVSAETLFMPLIRSLVRVPLLTLAAEVSASDEETQAAAVVGLIRTDGDLSDQVSTVDSVDTLTSRVAVVLGLEELGRGATGHYGLGPGASRQLPEPAQP